MELGLNIPATIPLAILDKWLVFTGEVDIGLRLATIPPITQVGVVDCLVNHFLLVILKKMSMLMRG